ncbi:MAG: hypothetical protein ACWA40_05030 [Planktomarina sp.]
MRRRQFLFGASAAALSGCGIKAKSIWADDAALARARYVHDGPSSFTLITVINVGSDNGAHTALLINASERVLFDPFGSFGVDFVPERNDVHFGMNPGVLDLFIDFHARREYYVVTQHVHLDPATAEDLYRRALQAGPIGQALCAASTSALLSKTPGLQGKIRRTLFPDRLSAQVAKLDGVITREWRDTDANRESAKYFPWPDYPTRYIVE